MSPECVKVCLRQQNAQATTAPRPRDSSIGVEPPSQTFSSHVDLPAAHRSGQRRSGALSRPRTALARLLPTTSPFESPDMSPARIVVLFHTLRLSFDARQAARREVAALRQAGQDLADQPLAATDDRLQPLFATLRSHRNHLHRLTAALANSLEADRADYASVVPWLRPLVVLRGVCDRAVLHHRLQACGRDLSLYYEALGTAAFALSAEGAARDWMAPSVRDALVAARGDRNRALAEQTERLRPFGGEPFPRWMKALAHEGRALAGACWRQLHTQLAPRVSALAGLAAGWWVASTYTDSQLRSTLRSLGIGRGGTHVVDSTTYRAMSFWLPIIAAATCAYLGDRLARAVRQRYEIWER